MLVSIVVPVFRNAESLSLLHSQITSIAETAFPWLDREIVFVDDGSDDGSWDTILELRKIDSEHVSAHRLSRNFGQLSAMLAGYQLAKGDCLISISADLQDPPNLIGQMVDLWLKGNDIVIANRENREDGFFPKMTSKIAYAFARKTQPRIPQGGFDFFLMSRKAIDLMLGFKGRYRFLQGDLLWLGLPTSYIGYTRAKRFAGQSQYTFMKKLGNFTSLIIDSSYRPIQLSSQIGITVAFVGIIHLFTIVASWLRGDTPFEGWAPIMAAILLLNGLLLILMGILGAYLWRIYDLLRNRPISVVLQSEYPKPLKYD